jgi:N-acetylglucosamine kinase-like BadF-type ATPase
VIIVGVDAGGSKTRAVAWKDGEAVGQAQGGAGAVRPGRALAAAGIIAEQARRVLANAGVLRADTLVVGAAGVGREVERRELGQALRGESVAERVVVVTDVELAEAAAFGDGPGIVLSAGTGSIAVGRDATGESFRQGGYGWQMSDEGSGYAIARLALVAVGRAADGRGEETSLTPELLRVQRCAGLDELVRWSTTAAVVEVAALASVVLAAAAAGDAVAEGITAYAALELTELVARLTDQITQPQPVPVALAGSLLGPGSPLRDRVLARLAAMPLVRAQQMPVDPLDGALHLAARGGRAFRIA